MAKDILKPCVCCGIDRDTTTMDEQGRCPFCLDTPVPTKFAKIEVKPKKMGRPPKPKGETPLFEAQAPAPAVKIPKALKPEDQPMVDAAFAIPYTPPLFDIVAANHDPRKELAMRELARRRFLPFVQRFRPKYLAGWVHRDVCRRLERFLKDVEDKKEPRLLMMMPPRSGKSELGSRHFPPWVLGKHPEWEVIAASHTSSLTLSFSRYIRDLVRDPAYQVLFEDMKLDPSSQSVENWNTLFGGGYLAAGVGTGITGRGAHILLLDDLVKDIEAADSPTIRENTWEWYISTAYTRLAPGGGVLGIMTWWNEADWAGMVQQVMESGDGDKFEIIRYPAINDEGDEYLLMDEQIVQIKPGDPVPDGAKMTRPMGTAIHPERYSTAAMNRIKNNLVAAGQKRIWNSLYQQNPTPDDGVVFTKEMYRYYVHAPQRRLMTVYQAWDFAITEEQKSDYTVCATIGQDEYDNLYVLHILRFRSDDGNAIVEHMIDNFVTHEADYLGVEDGQIWKTMRSQFEKRCAERRVYPSTEVLQPLTDKMVRANPLKGRMQLGKVFFKKGADWEPACNREMMIFPGGKHDDQVDALSWCTRLTLNHPPPKPPAPPKQKSWKDKLNALAAGGRGGHMAA